MRQVKEFQTADGKRYRVRFRQGPTETSETFRLKKDAQTFAAVLDGGGLADALAWLAARNRNTIGKVPTFGEFFTHTYLHQLTGITPRTRHDYQAMHRRYLRELDPLPVPLISRAHVAAIVNRLDTQGLSPKTIKNTIHMLSSVFNTAVDEGLIARNPTKRVRLPKAQLLEHEIRYLTEEEFGRLVQATDPHYRPLLAFLVGTGMRWSEATAIQGRHVNLAAGTIRVQQAWKRIPGGWELGPPKSVKANRTVNPAVMALAVAHALIGKPNDFLFTTPRGNVVRHSNFYNRIWQPAVVKAGLGGWTVVNGEKVWEGPTPHSMRHTHASWLISDGRSLEAVGQQLGHESIATTQIYAHLLPAVGVAVGKSASAALARALPDGLQGGIGALQSPSDTN